MSAPSPPCLVLFDVDGTLVHCGGAGKRALAHAFSVVLGESSVLELADLRGMTDLALFRNGCRAAGHEPTDSLAETLFSIYLEQLEREIAETSGYQVLPAVVSVLTALEAHPTLSLGLGTGNIEHGARIKLERGGLNRFFAFGGYGSDHADRSELLRRGAERGARLWGATYTQCRVVVVGDTPRDAEAAVRIGASCVGVMTGGYSAAALTEAGAAAVFPDLGSEGVVAAILDEQA